MKNKQNKLYGLVLAGGRSSRMQQDKSTLEIHDVNQAQHVGQLLEFVCDKVFVSLRPDQKNLTEFDPIDDAVGFSNIGPIGGILSSMKSHPDAAWVIVAIDLPLLNVETLQYLMAHRNTKSVATAFISSVDNLPEPLCTIYEPRSFELLQAFLKTGKQCPRKFLIHSDVTFLTLPESQVLFNMNTPEDLIKIKENFSNGT